jgi:hypothetical protein
MITGIDRLYLTTSEFEDNGAKWGSRINTQWIEEKNKITGEITEREVTSKQFFINDISHTGLSINKNSEGILLQFNPNRIITNTHFEIRPKEELSEALQKVDNLCKSKGISVDLLASKVFKIDLCRQAEMSYPIETYLPAFEKMQSLRLEQRKAEKGYYFESENSTGVFYDKAFQCRKKFKIKTLPENLMRFEQRFENSVSVKSNLKLNSIDGIGLINLDEAFNTFATKRIFRTSKQIPLFPALENLEYYYTQNKRGFLMRFIYQNLSADGGYQSLYDGIDAKFGGLKKIKQECFAKGLIKSREAWRIFVNKLNEEDKIFQRRIINSGLKPIDLIEELKTKFAISA